jgi:crotonobetainyl-CoA:carnitine CoA-transferase CaiB-like acyl-CoA transferase
VLGALVGRARNGNGGAVSSSLMAAAAWVGASDMLTGETPADPGRTAVPATPLTTSYACSDGRHLMINLMQSERYWSDFCKAIGAEELTVDPRFLDFATRAGHRDELHAEIAGRIGAEPLGHWREVFADFDGPWAPVQTVHEAGQDPQVRANGFVLPVDDGSGGELVRAPFTVGEVPERLPRAHELGEDTEVVLLEFGVAWDEIEDLKARGAVT